MIELIIWKYGVYLLILYEIYAHRYVIHGW